MQKVFFGHLPHVVHTVAAGNDPIANERTDRRGRLGVRCSSSLIRRAQRTAPMGLLDTY